MFVPVDNRLSMDYLRMRRFGIGMIEKHRHLSEEKGKIAR